MRREIRWSEWDDPGLGHLRLLLHNDGVVADGMLIGVAEGRPFRVAYEVRCDIGWRVRVVRVGAPDSELPAVDLLSDGGATGQCTMGGSCQNEKTPNGQLTPLDANSLAL